MTPEGHASAWRSASASSATRGASRSRPSDSTYSQPPCALDPPWLDGKLRVCTRPSPTASASMPPPHSTISCRSARALGRSEGPPLAPRPNGRAGDLDAGPRELLLRGQTDADLLLEGDLDRIARKRRSVLAFERRRGRQLDPLRVRYVHSRARRRPPGRRPPGRLQGRAEDRRRSPRRRRRGRERRCPSLSESETDSTARFFVETFCERLMTARASAYEAPAATASASAFSHVSRIERETLDEGPRGARGHAGLRWMNGLPSGPLFQELLPEV